MKGLGVLGFRLFGFRVRAKGWAMVFFQGLAPSWFG